jgi:Flp pilus assembly protein TadG
MVSRVKAFWRDERGSISLLIMSLFMATVIVSIILTNISSIYLAKRALTQATEAAAQRGVRNLDVDSYYQGEYNTRCTERLD